MYRSTTDFVGGACNGTAVFSAFDLERDEVRVRKAWFFLNNEVVCLSAGITSSWSAPVVTTANQCHLRGDVVIDSKPIEGNVTEKKVDSWVQHDGITYFFPGKQAVRLSAAPRTGAWAAISAIGSTDPVSLAVFTLWIYHGTTPTDASYVYVIAPGMADGSAYTTNCPVDIIANTVDCQAVFNRIQNILGVAFYTAGSITLPDGNELSVDVPCIVLVDQDNNTLTIADPTRANMAVRVTIGVWHKTITLPVGENAGRSVMKTIPG